MGKKTFLLLNTELQADLQSHVLLGHRGLDTAWPVSFRECVSSRWFTWQISNGYFRVFRVGWFTYHTFTTKKHGQKQSRVWSCGSFFGAQKYPKITWIPFRTAEQQYQKEGPLGMIFPKRGSIGEKQSRHDFSGMTVSLIFPFPGRQRRCMFDVSWPESWCLVDV